MMAKTLHISARDENAMDDLQKLYLLQNQSIIFYSGFSYLKNILDAVFEGGEGVSPQKLRQYGLPDGLIKIAMDLHEQGYEGISGFDDMNQLFDAEVRPVEKAFIEFDSGCVEAAVTGKELSSTLGHIRAPKLWQMIHEYQWQGCHISLLFKDMARNAVAQTTLNLSNVATVEACKGDYVEVYDIAKAFIHLGLNYNKATDRKAFVSWVAEQEDRLGVAFIIQDIAPTGDIFVYDGDQKFIRPDLSHLINKWGYTSEQIKDIQHHVLGKRMLPKDMVTYLKGAGFTPDVVDKISCVLKTSENLKYVFTKWNLGEAFCKDVLKISNDDLSNPLLNVLEYVGLPADQIRVYNDFCFGTGDFLTAPHLTQAHKDILMQETLSAAQEIEFMAELEKSIKGYVDVCTVVPHETTIDQLKNLSFHAWSIGLSRFYLVRENSDWESSIAFDTAKPEEKRQTQNSCLEDVA